MGFYPIDPSSRASGANQQLPQQPRQPTTANPVVNIALSTLDEQRVFYTDMKTLISQVVAESTLAQRAKAKHPNHVHIAALADQSSIAAQRAERLANRALDALRCMMLLKRDHQDDEAEVKRKEIIEASVEAKKAAHDCTIKSLQAVSLGLIKS